MSRNFEELEVWKKSCNAAVDIYEALRECRDYGLKDQMTRAAISIASNIAEGAERSSEKDFVRFLDIAKGSAGELRTQLFIAAKLKIVDQKKANQLTDEIKGISRMLQALQNSFKN